VNSWLFFVIVGQFLNATVVLTDRFIVTKKVVSKPIVYAFYVSFLSIFAIGALPFGVTRPSFDTSVLSLASAVSYLLSIYLLYESLQKSNPSEIVPVIGGIATISTLLSSVVILGVGLPTSSLNFVIGFLILISGMFLISHFKFTLRSFLFLVGSGVFFGLSTVLIKSIFNGESFVNGFFWSRIANVFVALSLLLIPSVYKLIRRDISGGHRGDSGHNKTLFVLGNKVLAGLAFVCILLAIKYGNVAIVNALTATQYVFIFIFAIFFSKLLPDYFKESIHRYEILHKSLATALIVAGFFVLFV